MNIRLETKDGPADVLLTKQKALFWPEQKLLALSDVHIGKAESLQSFGINVPSGEHKHDLERISNLIQEYEPTQVLVLGDWIHHKNSWTLDLQRDLLQFFDQHSQIAWRLLIGNHERGSRNFLETLPFDLIDGDLDLKPLTFRHGHDSAPAHGFQIQGHIHPVVRLRHGSTQVRLPCFAQGPDALILPSFGGLTGGFEINLNKFSQVYACTPSSVIPMIPQ